MSFTTFLLLIVSFALAGLLYHELTTRRKLAQKYHQLENQFMDLQGEHQQLVADHAKATAQVGLFSDKLEDIVSQLYSRHDDTITLFKRMRDIMGKLPNYRNGDRERHAHFNRLRSNLLAFMDNDVLGNNDAATDPLLVEIAAFQEEMGLKGLACQDEQESLSDAA
ncbi:hypothetical protein EF72_21400 [Salmonella enterica]|nr:hypothetical protein [Salmonella enterica]